MQERGLLCICGHAERDHGATGHCRVPGCPCETFLPMPGIGLARLRARATARYCVGCQERAERAST